MKTQLSIITVFLLGWMINPIKAQSPPDSLLGGVNCCIYELAEVTITEGKLPGEAQLLQLIQAQPLQSTEETLRLLPGVSLIRRGHYAQEPVLRGLNSNQYRITVDGMTMAEACTDKMDPVSSYVETNNLEGAEINHGAAGSDYGIGGGGNLNLQLAKPQFSENESWKGMVDLRTQSAAPGLAARANLSYGNQRLATRASFVYRKSEDYRAGGGEVIPYSGFEKINYSLGLRYKIDDQRELTFDFLGDNARNIGYPALPMDVAYANGYLAALTLHSETSIPGFLRWEARLYGNAVDHVMDDSHRDSVAIRMDMPGYTRTAGGWWQGDFLLGERHFLEARIDGAYSFSYAEMTMFPTGQPEMFMLTWPGVHRANSGGLLKHRFSINENLNLESKLRVEYNNSDLHDDLGQKQMEIFFPQYQGPVSKIVFSLSSEVKWRFAQRFTLEGMAGYGERMGGVSELFGYYIFNSFDGFDYLGNPFLRTEKSWQLQGSLRYRSERLEMRLTGFGYFFDDYIFGSIDPNLAAMTIGARGVKTYENLPSARLYGAEAFAVYQLHSNWLLTATGQYSYGQIPGGDPLPLIPPLSINGSLLFQKGGTNLRAEVQYNSAQNRVNPEAGEQTTPSYAIVNVRGSHTLKLGSKSLTFSAGVENILDHRYRNHLDWGGIPRLGRDIYAGLSFNF